MGTTPLYLGALRGYLGGVMDCIPVLTYLGNTMMRHQAFPYSPRQGRAPSENSLSWGSRSRPSALCCGIRQ